MAKRMILIFFCVLIFGAFIMNMGIYKNILYQFSIGSYNNVDISETVNEQIKDGFWQRDYFIDCKGISLKLLNKCVIDNFEYIKDSEGIIHLVQEFTGEEAFVRDLQSLANVCQEKDMPLIYVQAPQRQENFEAFVGGFQPTNGVRVENYIKDSLKSSSIKYMGFEDFTGLKPGEIYFKTDAHMTTAAELGILRDVVDVLTNQYGIHFNDKDFFLNPDNYEIDSRKFVGNFARSAGSTYTSVDQFEMYLPKFETEFATYDEIGNLMTQGSFEEALMNGYHIDSNSNKYTYWVTNYGHFGKSNYIYDNLANDYGPKILVICDSQAMRFFSYLSLMCDSVTIHDPRYDPYGNILSSLIQNNDYDAIVVMQSYTLLGHNLLYDYDLDAEIVSHDAPGTVTHTDSYTFDVTVKNTGESSWSESDQIRLCVWQDGSDLGYRLYLPDGVTVSAGEEYTFTLEGFVLPEAEQTILEFQMLQEGVQYFGEREPVVVTASQ